MPSLERLAAIVKLAAHIRRAYPRTSFADAIKAARLLAHDGFDPNPGIQKDCSC